ADREGDSGAAGADVVGVFGEHLRGVLAVDGRTHDATEGTVALRAALDPVQVAGTQLEDLDDLLLVVQVPALHQQAQGAAGVAAALVTEGKDGVLRGEHTLGLRAASEVEDISHGAFSLYH